MTIDAFARFRAQKHFGSLDGLRALSILAVIWHHCGVGVGSGWAIASAGAQGVTLFFAISGFLIVTLLLRERETHGQIHLRAFYWRRSLRIFPLYYAVLLLYVGIVWAVERRTAVGHEFFQNLPYFVTYTSNWFVSLEGRVIFYFVWSLAVEEQFYLVWPWVERHFSSLTATAIMAAVWLLVSVWQVASPTGAALAAKLPLAIGGGVLLAHGLHHPPSFAWLHRLLGQWWSAPSLAVICAVLLSHPAWCAAPVVAVAFVLLVGACVIREDHGLTAVLKWRPLAYLGTISYGMYLLHMLSKNAAMRLGAKLGWPSAPEITFLVTLLITLALASLSFRYFEAYFLRMKSRYTAVLR